MVKEQAAGLLLVSVFFFLFFIVARYDSLSAEHIIEAFPTTLDCCFCFSRYSCCVFCMAWVLLCFFFFWLLLLQLYCCQNCLACIDTPALHTYAIEIRILHRCLFMMTLLYSGKILLVQFVAFM